MGKSQEKTGFNIYIILYIFYPFFAFLFSLKHYNNTWFKNALWLFIIFFGFSMSFGESMDASQYKYYFELSARQYKNFSSFLEVFDSSKTGQVDFARPLINYILTSFTSNYHILFAVYGLIFGYFFSRNIDFLLQYLKNNFSKRIIGLIILCSFFIGIWQINGFRFWTAAHIFVFGFINFNYYQKKPKGALIILLSMVFHLSFLLPIIVFFIYRFIPKLDKTYLILILIFSIYNPLNNIALVKNYIEKLAYNEVVERKIDSYTSNEAKQKVDAAKETRSLLKKVFNFYNRLGIILLGMFILKYKRSINQMHLKFFRFGLMLALFGVVFSFVPSIGRFTNIGLLILLFAETVILLAHNIYREYWQTISNMSYIGCIIIIFLNQWVLFTFSMYTFFGNYLMILYDDNDILYSLGKFISDNT